MRDRDDTLRWVISGGVAFLMHAAVLFFLVVAMRAPAVAPPSQPMRAVMIEVSLVPKAPAVGVNAVPSAAAAAASEARREHERERSAERDDRQREREKKLPSREQTTPQVDARSTPKIAAGSEPAPSEAPHASPREPIKETPDDTNATAASVRSAGEATSAPSQPAAPAGSNAPVASQLAARRAMEGEGHDARMTWESILLGHLAKYRHFPSRAERSRQEGTAYVRFTVDRQGNVLAAELDRSSGHALLDEETMQTVRRASPVPPPPASIPGNPVSVEVPVVFSLKRI